MSFDILVRAMFADGGLSAGLAKANAGLEDLGRSAPGAHRGLRAVEGGMRALAFEAVGIQGPIGKISEGMLRLGGGSALVIGVVASLGLVAGAYGLFTRAAREAQIEQDSFIESLRKVGPHGAATASWARIGVLQSQVGKGPSSVGDRMGLLVSNLSGGLLGTSWDEQQERLKRGIRDQTMLLAAADKAMVNTSEGAIHALRLERETLGATAVETARLKVATENWTQAQKDAYVEEARRLQKKKEWLGVLAQENEMLVLGKQRGLARMDFIGNLIADDRARRKDAALNFSTIGLRPDVEGGKATVETFLGRKKPGGIDAAAIAANSVALIGAMQGGGAGGLVSAAGGLASALSVGAKAGSGLAALGPVGIGLTAAGGLLSLLGGQKPQVTIDAFSAQALEQWKNVRGEPLTTQVIVVGATDMRSVQQALARFDRMGVRTRLPR